MELLFLNLFQASDLYCKVFHTTFIINCYHRTMTPYVHAVRALTVLVFRRLLVPAVIFVGFCIIVLIIAIAVLAVQFTPWWLIAYLILAPIMIVLFGLCAFAWVSLKNSCRAS